MKYLSKGRGLCFINSLFSFAEPLNVLGEFLRKPYHIMIYTVVRNISAEEKFIHK